MKTHLIFTFLISIITFSSCDKNNDNSTEIGNVIFYTNAQALLNCGPFDVTIKINDESVGAISEAYVEDFQPNCTNTNSTLLIEKAQGSYNYTATIDCGQYGNWSGEFEIIKDSCIYVFLDINNCNPKND
ncbi:MAG: hypothetical protein JW870_17120 [Candidatus Delongbacteria bacterium]|nr:hypothetical protein [Candidatus Delongbacteria bacterium]